MRDHPLDKQGRTVKPAEKFGLGIEVNETAIAKHPSGQEVLQRVFYADGSVGDR